jgi:hypothetical protein
MTHPVRALREVPQPMRSVVVGAVALGALGAALGLLLGLRAYPPTAWFAVAEVGVPAAMVGALVGLVVGLIGSAAARRSRRPPRREP